MQGLVDSIIDFSAIGCELNKLGNVLQSTAIANYCVSCWYSIHPVGRQLIGGAVKGVVQAGGNVVHTVRHPIEPLYKLGELIGKIFKYPVYEHELLTNPVQAHDRIMRAAEKTARIFEGMRDAARDATLEDVTREVVCFAAEIPLYGVAGKAVGVAVQTSTSIAIKTGQQVVWAVKKAASKVKSTPIAAVSKGTKAPVTTAARLARAASTASEGPFKQERPRPKELCAKLLKNQLYPPSFNRDFLL